ncbi:hypothetical protein EB118_23730, partial [bacterium]|nr:hypothetical protein [bacterium]
NESLYENLDSKKHLVPFSNGVYDLLKYTFRKTHKLDLISKTTKYKYNPHANDPKLHLFINTVLGPHKDTVLKKLCEYLNRDISNPGILFNTHTPLLPLLKATLGDIFPKKRPTKYTQCIQVPVLDTPCTCPLDIHSRQTFMNILIKVYTDCTRAT